MKYNKSNNIDVKKENRNRIYKLICEKERISKPEIAYLLGISMPTVMQNVKSLQDEGLVEEAGVLGSTGGRKAVAISCVENARYSIGVDITRNHISAVLINLTGNIVEGIRVSKKYQNTLDHAQEMGKLIDNLIKKSGINPSKILGVGISVPGILSDDGLTLVSSYVLQVTNERFANYQNYIKYPYLLCNDANAAGIAEMWNRNLLKNAIYLSLSNTVGGSILLDNKIYLGENQRGGEFGHMTIERNGLQCYCGKKGCLDTYCSALVLAEHTNGNLADFFDLLKKGDNKIEAVWENYLDYLATAVNNLRMFFDCSVILGGYVGAYIDEYIDKLKENIANLNTFEMDGNYVEVCHYKREAAAVGAALLHIKPFIDSI